jgi:hypothetical protein
MKFKQILPLAVLIAVLPVTGNWNVDAANAKINFSVHGLHLMEFLF